MRAVKVIPGDTRFYRNLFMQFDRDNDGKVLFWVFTFLNKLTVLVCKGGIPRDVDWDVFDVAWNSQREITELFFFLFYFQQDVLIFFF